MASITRSDAKKQLQERQRAWLKQVIAATALKPTQLARGASVSDTTISRILNNPGYSGTLSEVTIERIKSTYKVPGPGEKPDHEGSSLILAEAERIEADTLPAPIAEAVKNLSIGKGIIEIWRLRSASLEGAGYLPGDLVVVDCEVEPRPHDAVCALVTEWARGGAETVWRIFDPPFLIPSAPRGAAAKPLLVDNQRVSIKGVVVASLRPHRLSVAS